MSLRYSLLACLILLGGLLLRVYQVALQSIAGDEIYSVIYSKMDWLEIIRFNIGMRDPQPPLYYFVLKAGVTLLGTSDFAYRLPSIFAGVASVFLAEFIRWALGGVRRKK